MQVLPKECRILEIEEKWERLWEEMGVYRFDWNDANRPAYSINTPPPYPSGNFHMGNVLNWTYFDMVARYKRMQGYNVLFPQGWDCHGLPTEVETEEHYGIKKTDVPPEEFRRLCESFVNKYIDVMKRAVIRLGCSTDWSLEYRSMNPDYWRRTQLSFVILHEKGFIYQGTHPINWCPRCETAIADAEVEYEKRQGRLHYIRFPLERGDFLTIATTRPELLPACVTVAVHPHDERYQQHIGEKIIVPLVGRKVGIIPDETVDPSFGTGVVMVCTYGDKTDVKTVAKHRLPVIIVIDEKGKMREKTGKYAGMTIREAREAVAHDLERENLLERVETTPQDVGVCWRCKTPVEIIEQKQWFMRTRKLSDAVERKALEVTWYPDYMKKRLVDWAESLDWDWVISRQRVFATPIPVWYCKECGGVVLAKPEWLPIDPKMEGPKIDKCQKCGSKEFTPERDVLDTWFDSSISCAVHAGWPDREDWSRLFPADLHPSGYDIIRTWAYYLMVRHIALFDEKPYKSCLINGMVLGTDGRKMSKSLGNYIATPEVFGKYGADATRQWAASGGATGSDIPFRWPDVEYGWRFLIKLWNAARFASQNLRDYAPQERVSLELLDRWLLSKLERLTENVTKAFESCQFNIATEEVRNFTWHLLCDEYIEAIKHRLYQPQTYGGERKLAAQHTLHTAVYRVLQLLAPISPHVTEEIYQVMYREEMGNRSIHVSPWPTVEKSRVDEEAERYGDLAIAMMGEVRREKAKLRMPLNAPIKKLVIFAGNEKSAHVLNGVRDSMEGTCKIQKIEILPEEGHGKEVEGHPNIRFVVEF